MPDRVEGVGGLRLVVHSRALRLVWEWAAARIDFGEPVMVRGEPGSGKMALLLALWAHSGRPGPPVTADAALAATEGPRRWMAPLVRATAQGCPAIVRHVDQLDGAGCVALGALVDAGLALATTGDAHLPAASARLADHFSVVVDVPPLRRHREDICPLAFEALATLPHGRGRGISREALAALEAAEWPGNVRQLRSAVCRAANARARGDIGLSDLPADCIGEVQVPEGLASQTERKLIQTVLATHQGRRSDTADALGISRSTLYRKLRRYGLDDRAADVCFAGTDVADRDVPVSS